MAVFKFGVSQEDIEREEAEHQRQLEYEVQARTRERNQKLEKLNRQNKRNRRIVIFLFLIFFISMLVFGTYNTFFKKNLSAEEVQTIAMNVSSSFNQSGVEGFLHDTAKGLFEASTSIGEGGTDIDTFELDPNSVRVNRIIQITPESAVVYFSANLNVARKDSKQKDGDEEILVPGENTYNKYQFRVLVEFKNKGYKYASSLELQPMKLKDHYSSDRGIEESEFLSFENIEEEEHNEALFNKIDRVLSDLYEGKDVGTDFEPDNNFNTQDTYKEISELKVYKNDNQLGYNATCTYSVESVDGIVFNNKAFIIKYYTIY